MSVLFTDYIYMYLYIHTRDIMAKCGLVKIVTRLSRSSLSQNYGGVLKNKKGEMGVEVRIAALRV